MQYNSKFLLGILLIIVGIVFLFDNLGFFYFNISHLIFSWYTILIVIGIFLIIKSQKSKIGIFLLVLGLYGLINNLFRPIFHLSFKELFPLIIIIIGIYFILKRNEHQRISKKFQIGFTEEFQEIANDYLKETCILSNCNKKIDSENFKGGTINVLLGTLTINLNDAKLFPQNNIIDITVVAGKCTIIVPRTWKVISNVTTIFGGFDIKPYSLNKLNSLDEGTLIVQGTVLFGGGEIKIFHDL